MKENTSLFMYKLHTYVRVIQYLHYSYFSKQLSKKTGGHTPVRKEHLSGESKKLICLQRTTGSW